MKNITTNIKNSLKAFAVIALLAGASLTYAQIAPNFTPPTTGPSASTNVYTPIHTGPQSQRKGGDLVLSSNISGPWAFLSADKNLYAGMGWFTNGVLSQYAGIYNVLSLSPTAGASLPTIDTTAGPHISSPKYCFPTATSTTGGGCITSVPVIPPATNPLPTGVDGDTLSYKAGAWTVNNILKNTTTAGATTGNVSILKPGWTPGTFIGAQLCSPILGITCPPVIPVYTFRAGRTDASSNFAGLEVDDNANTNIDKLNVFGTSDLRGQVTIGTNGSPVSLTQYGVSKFGPTFGIANSAKVGINGNLDVRGQITNGTADTNIVGQGGFPAGDTGELVFNDPVYISNKLQTASDFRSLGSIVGAELQHSLTGTKLAVCAESTGRLVLCDLAHGSQIYTKTIGSPVPTVTQITSGSNGTGTPGSFIVPAGVYSITVTAIGAGGGGGGGEGGGSNEVSQGGSGGGAGGYIKVTKSVNPGDTFAVSVGVRGNSGTGGCDNCSGANGTAGSAGGSSTFGSIVTAYGGAGGLGGGVSGTNGGGTGGSSTSTGVSVLEQYTGHSGTDHGTDIRFGGYGGAPATSSNSNGSSGGLFQEGRGDDGNSGQCDGGGGAGGGAGNESTFGSYSGGTGGVGCNGKIIVTW